MKRCSVCINDERVVPILEVDGRLLCRECIKQLPHVPDREKIREEVDKIMQDVDRAVLAFSGGKDSVVALYLAVKRYEVDVDAVMVDHGFMAEKAKENARRIAEYFGVPFRIIEADYSDIFRDALSRSESPCSRCSDRTMSILRQYARERGVKYIITGHEIPFGGKPYRIMKGGIIQIRLLSMMSEEERKRILESLPFEYPELPGYTTNCLILGVAIERFCRKYGYSPEHRRLAAMVRLGLMRRKRAEEEARCVEVPEGQRKYVLERLGLNTGKG